MRRFFHLLRVGGRAIWEIPGGLVDLDESRCFLHSRRTFIFVAAVRGI